ncbi:MULTISPECIES: hypothetical protein [unclassified Streptomyces]|uniref:hypothetical protein n=1 Tax=unclassified Streptomyces TaxID=2593676 RepID=UPI002366D6BE|nr:MULTISPECIES: hypothetical protein [unclassified Streptomyces]MDF3146081.1 hypothetical protein [Streptomyces sp. T21Q-yed]WDF40729.1 hypothetical protein PBV52_30075 [Streptomyces sp. T12]
MRAGLGGCVRLAVRLAVLLVPVSAALVLSGTATTAAAVPAQGRDVPDVAMVVSGGTGRTTALRTGEPAFARLWQLLQPTYVGTERVSQDWVEGRHPPMRMTVIWGLTGVGGWPQTKRPPGGDVAVQRQDQLFVTADGTAWVRSDLAPEVEDDDIRWHRAPRSVFERLDLAGLLGETEDELAAARTVEARPGPVMGDPGWAVAGLAVGFATGVGGTLLIRRAAARPGAGPPREEPRQELIDLDL